MYNCPEYVFSWFGLNKAGITVAFINTTLKKQGLEHCLKQSNARAVLVSRALVGSVADIQADFQGLEFYSWGQAPGWKDMETELKDVSTGRPNKDVRSNCSHDSTMAYIYTSGSVLSHSRLCRRIGTIVLT